MRAVVLGLVGAVLAGGVARSAELIRNPCHNDFCTWFSIEERQIVGTGIDGALVKATLKRWQSVHPGGSYGRSVPRGGGASEVAHFYCSQGRPVSMHWNQSTGWRVLNPVALNQPDEQSESAANEYMAVCHGVSTADEAGFGPLASRFGYHFFQANQRESLLKSPDEILGLKARAVLPNAEVASDDDIKAAIGPRAWPGKKR